MFFSHPSGLWLLREVYRQSLESLEILRAAGSCDTGTARSGSPARKPQTPQGLGRLRRGSPSSSRRDQTSRAGSRSKPWPSKRPQPPQPRARDERSEIWPGLLGLRRRRRPGQGLFVSSPPSASHSIPPHASLSLSLWLSLALLVRCGSSATRSSRSCRSARELSESLVSLSCRAARERERERERARARES